MHHYDNQEMIGPGTQTTIARVHLADEFGKVASLRRPDIPSGRLLNDETSRRTDSPECEPCGPKRGKLKEQSVLLHSK